MQFFIAGLTLLFIYLKMTNQIDWSWLWILSPLWIDFLVCLLILSVAPIIQKVIEKIIFSKKR